MDNNQINVGPVPSQNNVSGNQINATGDVRTTALKSRIEANFASSVNVQTAEQQRIMEYLKRQETAIMMSLRQAGNDTQKAGAKQIEVNLLNTISQELDRMFAANGAEIKRQGDVFAGMMNELVDAVRKKNSDLEEQARTINEQNATIEYYKQQLQQMNMGMGMQYQLPAEMLQPNALNQHPAGIIQHSAGLYQQPSDLDQNAQFDQFGHQANNGSMQNLYSGMIQQPELGFPLDPAL